MKKSVFLSFALTLLLLLLLPTAAFADRTVVDSGTCGAQGDNLTWALYNDGELVISGTGGMGELPWNERRVEIKTITLENGVTSIGWYAFSDCKNLTSISFPESVTYIGRGAFSNCTGLTSITLPGTLPSTGEYTFGGCTGLTSVTFSEGLQTFDSGAFTDCTGLTSITLPASVKTFYPGFNGCSNLTSIQVALGSSSFSSIGGCLYSKDGKTLICVPDGSSGQYEVPDGVTSINYSAFSGCTALTSISIPASVTSIDNSAFTDCGSLTSIQVAESNPSYRSFDGCLYNADYTALLCCPGGKSGSLSLPDSVTGIGNNACYGCAGLSSITIPGSVTSISNGAFYGCTGLTSVTISEGVTGIGGSAFHSCIALTSITIPGSVTSISNGAFYGCTGLTSVTLSEGIEEIRQDAFSGCTGLTSVTIPASASVYVNPFTGCSSLTSILVAEGSTGNCSKEGCLYSADGTYLCACPAGKSGRFAIPEGTTLITPCAFQSCAKLTAITLPESVGGFLTGAFAGCTGLNSVTLTGDMPGFGTYATIGPEIFSGVTATVYYPAGNETYTEEAMQDYGGKLTWVPVTVVDSGDCGAQGDNVKWTLYSNGELLISGEGDMADYIPWSSRAENIISLRVEDGVTSISEFAFSSCHKLTSIEFPDSVTSIGNSAFSGCSGLTSVTIPAGVTSIGDSAFSNCTGLTSLTLQEGLTSIGDSAFSFCTGLTSVTIPASVTSMGNWAFHGCTGLTALTVAEGSDAYCTIDGCLYSADQTSLIYCSREKSGSFTIPEGVTSIANDAFNDCAALTSVTIPTSVVSMYYYTFNGCTSLTEIRVTEGNPAYCALDGCLYSADKSSFLCCPQAKSGVITLPASVTSFNNYDVINCTGITEIHVAEGNSAYCALDGCLYNAEMTTLFCCPAGKTGNLVIPNGVTSIGDYACVGCAGLTSVTLPEGLTFISSAAFSGCTGLTSITLPASLTRLTMYAFYNCTSLTEFVVAEGNSVFCAFDGCLYSADGKSFSECPAGKTGNVTVREGTTYIGNHSFDTGCVGVTSVTLPASVTSIDYYAFVGCSFTVYYHEGSISEAERSKFTNLTWVAIDSELPAPDCVLPASLLSIDDEAFFGCAFRYVRLPDGAKSVGQYAFAESDTLEYIYIPESVTDIDPDAFDKVEGLTILGTPGSTAAKFAEAKGYTFREG